MFALQRALRRAKCDWLRIGGRWTPGEIPWFWCWEDRPTAAACAEAGQPFIAGPNLLFDNSARPCASPGEREVCQAGSCLLLFTESAWYRELIQRHRGPANRAPIVLWPYPIEPPPGPPLSARDDLLIYLKSGWGESLVAGLVRRFRRQRVIRYGQYERAELLDAARHARCCLYASIDDRGPLALAEILLCGCPAVGIPHGAPFIEPGRSGVLIPELTPRRCAAALEQCLSLDRRAVASRAAEIFNTNRIVATILTALRQARSVRQC